jgi:hypothetical protein
MAHPRDPLFDPVQSREAAAIVMLVDGAEMIWP